MVHVLKFEVSLFDHSEMDFTLGVDLEAASSSAANKHPSKIDIKNSPELWGAHNTIKLWKALSPWFESVGYILYPLDEKVTLR